MLADRVILLYILGERSHTHIAGPPNGAAVRYPCILIDLDDTLLVEERSAELSFLVSANHLSQQYNINPEDFVASVRKAARDLWYSLPTIDYALAVGISSWEALWADFTDDNEHQRELKKYRDFYQQNAWHNALQEHRIIDKTLARQLAGIFKEDRKRRHDLYEDTGRFLEGLAWAGVRAALVTNGTPDLQWQKIRRSGIERYFHAIVISGECGCRKPGKDIFDHALALIGASAGDCLMIGDSLETDIRGAADMGMDSAWLNRQSKGNASGIVPTYEISSLDEALRLL